ncbi:hypothetical protein [Neomoorella thermoacetica]|nr:hypothetical protein [Moorella thermoacetica]
MADARKIRERLGWVPAYDDLERIIYHYLFRVAWERKSNGHL